MSTSVSHVFEGVATTSGVSLGAMPPPSLLLSLPSFAAASVALEITQIVKWNHRGQQWSQQAATWERVCC